MTETKKSLFEYEIIWYRKYNHFILQVFEIFFLVLYHSLNKKMIDFLWAVNFEILNKIWNFNLIRIPSKVIKNRFHFVFTFCFHFIHAENSWIILSGNTGLPKGNLIAVLLNLQKKQHAVEEVGEVGYFKLRKTFECLEKLFTYLFTVFQVWSIVNCVWSARLYQYHILLSNYLEYWQG